MRYFCATKIIALPDFLCPGDQPSDEQSSVYIGVLIDPHILSRRFHFFSCPHAWIPACKDMLDRQTALIAIQLCSIRKERLHKLRTISVGEIYSRYTLGKRRKRAVIRSIEYSFDLKRAIYIYGHRDV